MENSKDNLVFNISSYDYKISNFLQIPLEQVKNTICQLSSNTIKKYAFLGDSYLGNLSALILNDLYPEKEVEVLACLKSFLVCNKTLANICDNLFYGDIIYLKTLNDHSKGTIFEAILHISKNYNTDEKIYQKIKLLFKSLIKDDDLEKILQIVNLEDFMQEYYVKMDSMNEKEYFEIHELIDKNITSLNQNLIDFEQEDILRPMEIKQIISKIRENKNKIDHTGEHLSCFWRSRKNRYYNDSFYSCCGTPVNTKGYSYQSVCPRSNWSNPLSYHTGMLHLYSSRKLGGGIVPRGSSDDHIPHCRTPEWTCCGKVAHSEGCRVIKNSK